jgi:acetate kinase
VKILVINCGSSSIKYRLFDMRTGDVLGNGLVSRIGEPESRLVHNGVDRHGQRRELERSTALPDHRSAFRAIEAAWHDAGTAQTFTGLSAIGHRVVHGGERFQAPTLIDPQVVAAIRDMCTLAPLHNPANLAGIEVYLEAFPQLPQVAVFDTAFHQSMPEHAYRYAIPETWYREHQVRRYGFQGTSHGYVARQAAHHLQRDISSLNLVTLHLGNGASAAAIRGGRCVDTSMGFTPLEGLIMGTRSGDIDPAMLFHIGRRTGADLTQLEALLNRDSGLKGICGANDMRDIQQLAEIGDTAAQLAVEMYCYRIRKYIGAYCAVLGRLDALVFTAGIGENSAPIRQQVCAGLDGFGISLDVAKNAACSPGVRDIQVDGGKVKVLVAPTNEELEIAQQTATCIAAP